MLVVDTSAWIEWLTDGQLAPEVEKCLPDRQHLIVPTLVQLELAKWLCREVGEDRADEVLAFTEKCIVVPLDTRIALGAADACRRHRLATADAIIFATAAQAEATLLTCDAHFKGLPGVRFLPKAPT